MKAMSWILLIILLVISFFLLKDILQKHVIKTEDVKGLWFYFYIGAPISFIICLYIMYKLTEEVEWNPYGSALVTTLAFPLIIALIALVIAIAILVLFIYVLIKLFGGGEKSAEYRKVGEGEFEVWEKEE
jgi:hypothetical protein